MLKFAQKNTDWQEKKTSQYCWMQLECWNLTTKNERQLSFQQITFSQITNWQNMKNTTSCKFIKKQCDWEIQIAKKKESNMNGFDWLQQITYWQRKKGNQYDWVQLAFSLWFFSEGILVEARKALTSCGNGSQLTIDHLQWQWQWQRQWFGKRNGNGICNSNGDIVALTA